MLPPLAHLSISSAMVLNSEKKARRYDAKAFAQKLAEKGSTLTNGGFNWERLGLQVGVCFSALPSNCSFLYGPLDAEYTPKERERKRKAEEEEEEEDGVVEDQPEIMEKKKKKDIVEADADGCDQCTYPACPFANGEGPSLERCQNKKRKRESDESTIQCHQKLHHVCQTEAEAASIDFEMDFKCCFQCHPHRGTFLPNPREDPDVDVDPLENLEKEIANQIRLDQDPKNDEEPDAALEVLQMLANHEEHELHKKAYDEMMDICTSFGYSSAFISNYLQGMQAISRCGYWEDSKRTYKSVHRFDRNDDGEVPSTLKNRGAMHRRIKHIVDSDLADLICKAMYGNLVINSWFSDCPNKRRKTRLPSFSNYERNHHRAKFLNKVMPGEQITLMHNGVLSFHVPSGIFYQHEYCVGYHCHTTSFDMEESDCSFESNFCGDSVHLSQNSVLRKIHDISVPSNTELNTTQNNNDPMSVPDEQIRESSSYKNLFPDRERLMSLAKLRDRIGMKRLTKLVAKWRRRYIFPNDGDVLKYFRDHINCHMIIPPNFLGAEAISSSPHLLDHFHFRLRQTLHGAGGSRGSGNAGEDGGGEGGSRNTEGAGDETADDGVSRDAGGAHDEGGGEGSRNTEGADEEGGGEGNEANDVNEGGELDFRGENSPHTGMSSRVDGEADAGAALLHLAGAVHKKNSPQKSPLQKYEEIKRKSSSVEEQVKTMLDYLKNGDESTYGRSVMKMLRGDIPGIGEDDPGDYVYVNTNFFRAIQSQMTKDHRWLHYHTNMGTDHGRYMCCAAVGLDYLREAKSVPLGGCHNTIGHKYLLRVNIPVPMFKNHIIEHGGGDRPISNMVCMVTMNNYCRTALEVHQFEFIE